MSIVSSSQKTLFSGLNVTASGYRYNDSGGTTEDIGWQTSKYTDCVIQIGVATLGTKPIKYRIEGRFASGNRAASIAAGSVSGADIDILVPVDTSKTPQVRVGVKVATLTSSLAGAANNLYCKLLLTDRR